MKYYDIGNNIIINYPVEPLYARQDIVPQPLSSDYMTQLSSFNIILGSKISWGGGGKKGGGGLVPLPPQPVQTPTINAAILRQIFSDLSVLSPSYQRVYLDQINLYDERYNGQGPNGIIASLISPEDLRTCIENIVITDPSDGTDKSFKDTWGDTMSFIYYLITASLNFKLDNPNSLYGIYNVLYVSILSTPDLLDSEVPPGLPDRDIYDDSGNTFAVKTFRDWGGMWVEGNAGRIIYTVYTPSRQGALNMTEIKLLYDLSSVFDDYQILFSADKDILLQTDEFNPPSI